MKRLMKQMMILTWGMVISLTSIGQGVWMSNTIRTPQGNVTVNTFQPGMPMYYGNFNGSIKYNFTVVMRDDSVFTQRMSIDVSEKTHKLKVKSGRARSFIFPGDTKQISRVTPEGRLIKGLPADTCWLFQSVKGKINCYSFLAEEGYDFLAAMQEGNEGLILPITKTNLLDIMQTQDEKILGLIERKQWVKAIRRFNQQE
jgi:hypothetical protein